MNYTLLISNILESFHYKIIAHFKLINDYCHKIVLLFLIFIKHLVKIKGIIINN